VLSWFGDAGLARGFKKAMCVYEFLPCLMCMVRMYI
jgi:hypothetical protein